MKIISSFSGGKTSAYMTIVLKEQFPDLIVLFANTGQEREETLDFVNKCDMKYNLGVIWIESKTFDGKKSSGYNIVDFESADRKGVVFELMIKKYGIPNKAWPHCTRELKMNPIKSWIRDHIGGHIGGHYKMAIGIRFDERGRVSKDAEKNNLFYPLVEQEFTKIGVNDFWGDKSFNLELRDYEGNCRVCFKKSNNKLLTIAYEHPEYFDFTDRMEREQGLAGCNLDGNRRVFFRGNKSSQDILKMAALLTSEDIEDFKRSIDPDAVSPCSESCEAFGYEQLSLLI